MSVVTGWQISLRLEGLVVRLYAAPPADELHCRMYAEAFVAHGLADRVESVLPMFNPPPWPDATRDEIAVASVLPLMLAKRCPLAARGKCNHVDPLLITAFRRHAAPRLADAPESQILGLIEEAAERVPTETEGVIRN